MKRVIIIGGGIAGLSAAYHLIKSSSGSPPLLDVTLLERDGQWGGKIVTERVDGYIIEGGPDTFLASKPWGVGLCRELGLGESLQGTNPRHKKTYVLHEGQLKPLPDGLAMMVPTHFVSMARTPLLSMPAKVRMGLDLLLPPQKQTGDESLGAFITRRLGRPAYENLIEPLMSGIYAGDGDQLSLEATFPFLREMEMNHGGLIRGAFALRQKASGNGTSQNGSRSAFLTPTTGLAEIVEKLVDFLSAQNVQLVKGEEAGQVQRTEDGFTVTLKRGEKLQADGVILAAPAFASAELIDGLNPFLASDLRAIPYVTTATVSLAYPLASLPRPLDGYGYVIPRREQRKALACTWTSTKFPHRSPEGFALLRVFIGRAGDEERIAWNEGNLLQIARQELELTLGISAEPALSRVFIWEKAMPQYTVGHTARLIHIQAALSQNPGIALAGSGYRGIGIPDCIHSGDLAAQTILKHISP